MADIVISVDSSQVKSASGDVNQLGLTVVKQAQVIQRLEKHYKLLDKAFNTGKISAQQYSLGVQQLDKAIATVQSGQFALAAATDKTTNAIEAQNATVQRAHKGVNKFGMVSQQVGYQVGDFFVQVQSGTNALTAFGQQATQLAGLLPGLAGAIVGIGVSLGTAFLNMSLRSKGLTISFQKMGEDLSKAFDPLRPMLDFIPKALGQVTDAVNNFGQMVAQNFDRAVAYTVAFATLLTTKVVAGFVLSGAAATAFFGILRVGLISTGIGALVVIFGEALLGMNRLIKGAGGFSAALVLMKNVAVEVFQRIAKTFQAVETYFQAMSDKMQSIWKAMIAKLQENWGLFLDILSVSATYFGADKLAEDLDNSAVSFRDSAAEIAKSSRTYASAAAKQWAWAGSQIDSAINDPLTSWQTLMAAFGKGATANVSIDPSSWVVPDTDKNKSGKESQLAELIREQKERAVLLTLYGEEKRLQQEIFAVRKQLGDEASKLNPKQIEDLAKINLLLDDQERLQQDLLQGYQQISDTISSSMENAFMSMVEGTESVKDAFKKMAYEIVKELYRVLVVQRLVGTFNMTTGQGSGIVGFLGGALTGGSAPFFGGGRATGGSMMPNRPYLVGEHGPELVIPRHSGTVVNANQTAGAMSGGGDITVQNNITVTGSDAAMVRAEVAKMIPQITNATKAAVIDAKQRGGQMAAAFR